MDYLTALLESQTPTMALKPRLPALFEPLAVGSEMGVLEETAEVEAEEPRAKRESGRRLAGEDAATNRARERTPFRGVMSVPPVARDILGDDEGLESENGARQVGRRAVEELVAVESEKGTKDTGGESRRIISPKAQARGDAPSVVSAIRPAVVVEARAAEKKDESESKKDALTQTRPLVRVSIGRIVVRAVTPATPSAPTKRRVESKKLSLDDYLKKGERGDR